MHGTGEVSIIMADGKITGVAVSQNVEGGLIPELRSSIGLSRVYSHAQCSWIHVILTRIKNSPKMNVFLSLARFT